MKNIHLIPTDKPSRLHLGNSGLVLCDLNFGKNTINGQNIYITSNEEIKDVRPHKDKWQLEKEQILNKFPNYLTDLSECKLIILTTDQDLIKDGVQAIDDEFLEWFVKNPSCKNVEVEKTFVTNSGLGYQEYAVLNSDFKVLEVVATRPQSSYKIGLVTKLDDYEYVTEYKIIIPQEESKQETLEEAAEKEFPLIDTEWCRTGDCEEENLHLLGHRKSFIKGAKWQSERMYCEEEVYHILCEHTAFLFAGGKSTLSEWFEQFKKKD
jgi:hypothetical protein